MSPFPASTIAKERIAAGCCLLCLSKEGPFTAREHPFPEGLGNEEFVLPAGLVCDPCNYGALSRLDQAFLDFPPIAFLRVTRGIRTKSGAYPISRWGNAVMRQTGPSEIHVRTNSKSAWVQTAPGRFQFRFTTGNPLTDAANARIGRAIWKMALELLCLDDLPLAFDPKFDELREVILGKRQARGWVASLRNASLKETVSLTFLPGYQIDGEEAMFVHLDVLGLVFFTELLQRDATRLVARDALPGDVGVVTFGK